MNNCLIIATGAFGSYGGIAAVNRMVIECLTERYNLNILTLNDEKHEMYDLPLTNNEFSYSPFNGNKIRFTLAIWYTLITKKYTLIICDHVNLACILAPFSKPGLINYYIWLFGIEVFYPKPTWEGIIGMKSAVKCLAISNYTADHIRDRFPSLNIEVCEIGLSSRFQPINVINNNVSKAGTISLRNITGNSTLLNEFFILHVGQMNSNEVRNKGQDILINAFPLIIEEIHDAQLVLVGEGENFQDMFTIASKLPSYIQDKIFLTGYLPDNVLDDVYENCFLFAMPSIGEGFGLVYLEAFIHSKPCIGSRSAAVPEIINHGINGLLVDNPRSPEEISEKIIWLMKNPDLSRKMGREGYKKVKSNYLFKHFKARFWKVIQ